jgi:hypothetical protein
LQIHAHVCGWVHVFAHTRSAAYSKAKALTSTSESEGPKKYNRPHMHLLTQRCRKERRVVVLVQVGAMLQAAAAANGACVVRAVAAGRMARSGAAGASRWVLNE